jgi:glycosyltransferase involved in cell wall biosynthesis
VIPAYNEQDNLPALLDEIRAALAGLDKSWEIVFIDDGSKDNTLPVLRSLADAHPQVRYLSLAQNRGQSAAFSAGFQEAAGDIVVTLDADLQNDPADIPAMIELFELGPYDMVVGWRAKRQDTWIKRKASRIANAIRNYVSQESIKDTGCSLKCMRASMLKKIPMYTGMHRFLPTLMKLQGARVAEMRVRHRPRKHGVSKYGVLDRAMTTWCDLLAVRWMKMRHISYDVKERR